MPQVLFTAAARANIADELAWYEASAPEAAPQFQEALRGVVGRIERSPRQFPATPHNTRRALLRRFPYLVIFREIGNDTIVVAVFHTRRDPRARRARMS